MSQIIIGYFFKACVVNAGGQGFLQCFERQILCESLETLFNISGFLRVRVTGFFRPKYYRSSGLLTSYAFHFTSGLFSAFGEGHGRWQGFGDVRCKKGLLDVLPLLNDLFELVHILLTLGNGRGFPDNKVLCVKSLQQLNYIKNHAPRKFGPLVIAPVSCCIQAH